MRKIVDITGKRFGMLTVLKLSDRRFTRPNGGTALLWWVECDCGKVFEILGDSLKSNQKSCGCSTSRLRRESQIDPIKEAHPLEYSSWQCMKARCKYENRACYKDYGGRGITVCKRWENSFADFLEDMGKMPSIPEVRFTIERINNNGNYEPGNCRWATYKEQSYNSRRNRLIEFQGETKPLKMWAEQLGLDRTVIESRINLGWSIERALTTPLIENTDKAHWYALTKYNQDRSKKIEFRGKSRTLKEWSEHLKINYYALFARINKYGWTIEKAFTTPSKRRR